MLEPYGLSRDEKMQRSAQRAGACLVLGVLTRECTLAGIASRDGAGLRQV